MTYKYNNGFVIHIGLTIVAYMLIIKAWGWGVGTIGILVFCGITTMMFNCYRIDITNHEMIVYQIHGGKTRISWHDIESLEISKNRIDMPILGSVKNMTVKIRNKRDVVVNIEPVVRDDMIEAIQQYCTVKKIE